MNIQHSSSFLILILAASAALANDLSIDRRSVRAGEYVTITVSLEDDFASIVDVRVPAKNLTVDARPSVQSEFTWINGESVRRKIFRFRARAGTAGTATVGPLSVTAPNGLRAMLRPVSLQVLPDRAAGSNDPVRLLRELLASGRDPLFIVAEIDKQSAYVGEQVVVTWWLYNAARVQQWQIGAIPKLDGFWVEELDVRSARSTQSFVGDYAMEKLPIRRVALFPLRSGITEIGSMEVQANVLRSTDSGLWEFFREGRVVETSFASAPLTVDIRAIPAGASVAAVGDLSLRCSLPVQENGGPVALDATLSGRGNVRSAAAPRFTTPPAGDVQVIDSGVSVDKGKELPAMTRRWKYVIFPATAGTMTVPSLELPIFAPASQARTTLRCEQTTLAVTAAAPPEVTVAETARVPVWPYAAGVGVIALAASLTVLPLRRRLALRREVHTLMGERTPAEIRDAVHDRLERNGLDPVVLLRERTDRGEAYRSLRSLLDALERDRIDVGDPRKEVRRRLRDLLVT